MSAEIDVEGRLADALDDLPDDMDEVTASDLEAFRQELNRIEDPVMARAVEAWLPFPLDETFEFVETKPHRSNYWRSRGDRGDFGRARSDADAERMERFAEAARETVGLEGTAEHEGRVIPASAKVTAEAMRGREFVGKKVASSGRKALRRLRRVLGLEP